MKEMNNKGEAQAESPSPSWVIKTYCVPMGPDLLPESRAFCFRAGEQVSTRLWAQRRGGMGDGYDVTADIGGKSFSERNSLPRYWLCSADIGSAEMKQHNPKCS